MANKHTASEEVLGLTHAEFAEWCRTILKGIPLLDKYGRAVLKEDGQPWLIPPSPAYMSVIRQFLKDNAMEAAVIPLENPNGKPLDDLAFDEESGTVIPFQARSGTK